MTSTREIPNPHSAIFVTGSGLLTRYWAAIFRDGKLERRRGPFSTSEAAHEAFLPVKIWPRGEGVPR